MTGMTNLALMIVAAAIPVAVATILGNSQLRTVHWVDVLKMMGVSILPMTVVLAMEGVIGPIVTMGILAIFIGHTIAYVDTD